eukprot:CAMPEP_0168392798 /NCGR_PEP_ID=MMETSP0228-20121227/18682_1 /TAXON_ID=133427 /ORGANISM="Protoceratium reticulatum, Strain CCCM 535 (=CCMP 1889)" /LENGTH=100 /DNA_ID=CAMNT_0008406147 /DNA_START=206 /DNA_END=506 /DNA_ORIENTATION=+
MSCVTCPSAINSALQFPEHVLFDEGVAFLDQCKIPIALPIHPGPVPALLAPRGAAHPHPRAVHDAIAPQLARLRDALVVFQHPPAMGRALALGGAVRKAS